MSVATQVEDKLARQERTRLFLGGANDDRIIATMRLGLALLNLPIVYTNPALPQHNAALIYAVLLLYVFYSFFTYLLTLRRRPKLHPMQVWSHWIDLSFYTLLVAFTDATNGAFFLGLTFPILVASFRWGFVSGLRVVIVSAMLLTGLGFYIVPPQSHGLSHYLLWPIYLLALGYMIAYWCGFEITLKRRLTLLKDITKISNPRFGIDETINSVLKRLCVFYNADISLLILDNVTQDAYYFRCEDVERQPADERTRLSMNGVSGLLSTLPPQYALAYNERSFKYGFGSSGNYAYDVAEQRTILEEWPDSEKLAAAFDAGSFITIPLRSRREVVGRICISSQKSRAFKPSDVHFLLHIADHLMPVINHIKLVDRLMLTASEEERNRIARDIHDGIIQPYIGLQMGLAGVRRKLIHLGISEVSRDIEQLIEITDKGIDDLRSYVRGLKEVGERNLKLLPAIRRFASKFTEASEIKVDVYCESESCVNDRLASEVFQIVVEGLSNIRRHTPSEHAVIRLRCEDELLVLQVENSSADREEFKPFIPHSITERATALGGLVHVSRRGDGGTIVRAEIPL